MAVLANCRPKNPLSETAPIVVADFDDVPGNIGAQHGGIAQPWIDHPMLEIRGGIARVERDGSDLDNALTRSRVRIRCRSDAGPCPPGSCQIASLTRALSGCACRFGAGSGILVFARCG